MKMTSIRKVKSADRTLDLLETLAKAAEPMHAATLADALNIPKSSLFHLLGTLTDRGYTEQLSGGAYQIGPMIEDLARSRGTGAQVPQIIEPVLADLCTSINETCSFNVQTGDEVEVVATKAGRQALTYTMQPGDLAPLYAVSSGKILLAEQSDAWVGGYLDRVRFETFTPHTIRSPERLQRDIDRARSEGFGFVEEEFTPGIVGLAVAIRRNGTTVGALNVAIPSVRCDSQKLSQVRQQLRIAANRATALLTG